MNELDPDQRRRQAATPKTADCPTASPGKDEAGNCLPIPDPSEEAPTGRRDKTPAGGNTSAGALNTGPGAAGGGLGSNQ